MLTDRACRNAKPLDELYKPRDENGRYLEVRPSGAKFWRYRFQLHEGETFKENMFAIGDYVVPPRAELDEAAAARRAGGSLTLAEARIERDKARALVKQGSCSWAAPEVTASDSDDLRVGGEGMAGAEGLVGRHQETSARLAQGACCRKLESCRTQPLSFRQRLRYSSGVSRVNRRNIVMNAEELP